MDKTLKVDDLIMKALSLKTISRIICQTDKGMLALQIRKGDNKYHLVLDSVPLDKEVNLELMNLLFPMKIETERYMNVKFKENNPIADVTFESEAKPIKHVGRPKVSKKK